MKKVTHLLLTFQKKRMIKKRKIWKIKVIILFLGILPSFTSYFIKFFESSIFRSSEISIWYIMYIIITFILIYIISGQRTLTIGVVAASLLAISVVFVGGFISYIRSGFSTAAIQLYSPHYVIILLNTMAVLPISIALLNAIPILDFEINLLNRFCGVTRFEKNVLIGTRIFNHIIYNVFPNILIVMREEKKYNQLTVEYLIKDTFLNKMSKVLDYFKNRTLKYFYLLLTLLINSIEFIPLWAIEINKLPSKKEMRNGKRKGSN